MTYADWWENSGKDENGKRSNALKAIDRAFRDYTEAGGMLKTAKLLELFQAISAWQDSKKNVLGTDKWMNSKRVDAVRALAAWVVEKLQERTVEDGWDTNHNCYAYAMKCKHPQGRGNNSRPGQIAGAPYSGANGMTWKQDMTAAIQADAVHDNKVITVLPQTNPTPCPDSLGDGRYLVALVGFQTGYHFMRRDEHTQRWSHKNGSAADVATIAYNIPRQRYLMIDNLVAVDMIANPANWLDVTRDMRFIAYLWVPNDGIDVAGPA